jgi:transcriptional regulator GlxA family with amidase domain
VAHLIEQRKPRSHPLARRLDDFVREHSSQPDLSLRVLTGRFHVSERYVCRLFRDELKTTFRSRLRRHRLVRAKELLSSTQLPMRKVAEMCGFTHQKRLSEAFMREERMTPRWFRQLAGSD